MAIDWGLESWGIKPAFSPDTVRALIVCSDPVLRNADRKMLREAGFVDIVDASNPTTAIASLRDRDLVLVEWADSAVDLVRAVRAEATTAKMPVIVMSSATDPMRVIEAKKAGAQTVLIRPLAGEAALSHIKQAVEAVAA